MYIQTENMGITIDLNNHVCKDIHTEKDAQIDMDTDINTDTDLTLCLYDIIIVISSWCICENCCTLRRLCLGDPGFVPTAHLI